MKKIGIIGTRQRNSMKDYLKVKKQFLELYEEGDWIVSGGCELGGDIFALRLHKQFFTPYLEFPANWKKYGKAAGFVRNPLIAINSDILIACVSPNRTGGTENTIEHFLKEKSIRKLYLVE